MSNRVQVLDHGYIELVESWGSDEQIIEAARMSTGKGFLGWTRLIRCTICGREWECENNPAVCTMRPCENSPTEQVHPGDMRLLRYLYTETPKHTTPFEMAGMIVEVQAPIMVYREWHRHRTQSFNEMSGRYVALPDVNYTPTVERLTIGSDGKNKQAGTIKGADVLDAAGAEEFRTELVAMWAAQEKMYQKWLARGVPKELARVHIGVGRYSRMRASANLLNWLKFLTLRMHHKAQWEIRRYANEVGRFVEQLFPRTWSLFAEETLNRGGYGITG